jgi:L-galactonate dehydratase
MAWYVVLPQQKKPNSFKRHKSGCNNNIIITCFLRLYWANLQHQTFTIGRGNELVCAAIPLLANRIRHRTLESLVADWGATWRHLVADSQLRWIGPEKGVIHLALGAVVNALWDLWAKVLQKPVWRIIADMAPEEIVRLIDFRYIVDALTPEEALELLKRAEGGKGARIGEALRNEAVPAYTTSAGWLGYGREKMERILRETLDAGYKHFKMKVGTNIEEDKERLSITRSVIEYDKGNVLMVDANQVCTLWSFWTLRSLKPARSGLFPKPSTG